MPKITGISSMATKLIQVTLADPCRKATGHEVAIEAIGGVDAVKRVRAGEAFDLVVHSDKMIATLESEGHVLAGTRTPFVRSSMVLAVKEGAVKPEIATEAAIKAVILGARSVGYSTGPSGDHLVTVLKSWGLDPASDPKRFVQAKPGIPVAALIASGEAEIGVQQKSEFLGEAGIEIVGFVPLPVQTVTTFSMGVGAKSAHVEEAKAVIAYFASTATAEAKDRCGMEPV